MEATHHGPSLKKPCCFIEIGSGPDDWPVEKYGKIVAKVLKKVVGKEKEYKTVMLLGGGHYGARVNQIMGKTEYAVGHHCPKYNLQYIDKEMLQQALDKHKEKVEFVVLDWKGMGSEKKRILELLPWESFLGSRKLMNYLSYLTSFLVV